jgi:hypothetical protein
MAATSGIESVLPMLPEVIIGNTERLPYLVGGGIIFPDNGGPITEGHEIVAPGLHRLSTHKITNGDRTLTVAVVHLFADYGFPQFHVVMREDRQNERSASEN